MIFRGLVSHVHAGIVVCTKGKPALAAALPSIWRGWTVGLGFYVHVHGGGGTEGGASGESGEEGCRVGAGPGRDEQQGQDGVDERARASGRAGERTGERAGERHGSWGGGDGGVVGPSSSGDGGGGGATGGEVNGR